MVRDVARSAHFIWITVVLTLLLLGSNAYWLFVTLDTAVTLSYRDSELAQHDAALSQAQKLLPAAFGAESKDAFVVAAQRLLGGEGYEKDGCFWLGGLGFQFDEEAKLVHVARGWSYGEPDPCFPSPAS